MVKLGEMEAGSAGMQPCRGTAGRAHLDNRGGRRTRVSRSSQTRIGPRPPCPENPRPKVEMLTRGKRSNSISGGAATPSTSVVRMGALKGTSNVSDERLVLADITQLAPLQTVTFVTELLLKHLPKGKAAGLARVLTEGRFTPDFPLMADRSRQLGLPVSINMPCSIYALMDLDPHSGGGRPSVSRVPLRRLSADRPGPAVSPLERSARP